MGMLEMAQREYLENVLEKWEKVVLERIATVAKNWKLETLRRQSEMDVNVYLFEVSVIRE